jgi:hypothetical protein
VGIVVGTRVGAFDGGSVGILDGASVGDSVGRRVSDSTLEFKLLPMYMNVRLLGYVPYKAPLTQIFEHSLVSLASRFLTPQKFGNDAELAFNVPVPAPQHPSSALKPYVVPVVVNLAAVMPAPLLNCQNAPVYVNS